MFVRAQPFPCRGGPFYGTEFDTHGKLSPCMIVASASATPTEILEILPSRDFAATGPGQS